VPRASHALDIAITFAFSAVLIAAMFEYLPDAEIEWRDSWIGGGVTAVLFIVGKHPIGFYIARRRSPPRSALRGPSSCS